MDGETPFTQAGDLMTWLSYLDEYLLDVLLEHEGSAEKFLAKHLVRSTVVQADATRRSILEEERVGSADYFIACTGDDENNIMAGRS